jgi:hypothetical protein
VRLWSLKIVSFKIEEQRDTSAVCICILPVPVASRVSPLVCCRTATAGSPAALSQVITPEVEGQCPPGHLWPLVFDLTADKSSRHSAVRKHFVIGEQNKERLISSFCGGSQTVGTESEDSCIDSGKDKNGECSAEWSDLYW